MSAVPPTKLNEAHLAILDFFLLNPFAGLKECAEYTGYSVPWICIIKGSDVFKEKLEKERGIREGMMRGKALAIQEEIAAAANSGIKKMGVLLRSSCSLEESTEAVQMLLTAMGQMPTKGGSVAPVQINFNAGPVSDADFVLAKQMFGRRDVLEIGNDREENGEKNSRESSESNSEFPADLF